MTQLMTPAEVAAYTGARSSSATKSAGCRAAKRAGDSWEAVIMANQGEHVRLVRVPNGARWISARRQIPVKSPFDFAGSFTPSGLGLFFDAKSCGPKLASFPLGNRRVVEIHQIDALDRMLMAGAVAGLLVRSERIGAALWLDAQYLRDGGRIGWDDRRWVYMGLAARPEFGLLYKLYSTPNRNRSDSGASALQNRPQRGTNV